MEEKKELVCEIVRRILEKDQESRDNDKRLMFLVWREQGFGDGHDGIYIANLTRFMQVAHPKSIIESRRNLQRDQEEKIAMGKHIPDDKLVVSKPEILELRNDIARQKGTHIFRDQVTIF